MLKITEIISKSLSVESNAYLFEVFDINSYQTCIEKFRRLDNDERKKYKSQDLLYENESARKLSVGNKNYHKLYDEIAEKLKSSIEPPVLHIDSFGYEDVLWDLLRSIESESRIREIYKKKKLAVKGTGLNADTAEKIVDCLRQGRGLFEAGKIAGALSKPLIYFYSFTSFAYAIAIMNSPIRFKFESMKNSHGHKYNHDDSTIRFGGGVPWGTFGEIMVSIPVTFIKEKSFSIRVSNLDSILHFQKNEFEFSILTLLSMIPEVADYFKMIDPNNCATFALKISTELINEKAMYIFVIGNGTMKPDRESIEDDFPGCDISEEHGNVKITVSTENMKKISPNIYQDSYGNLAYIKKTVPSLVLPEICLHFLIMSWFSIVMRYAPYEWSKILTNGYSSEFTLLVNNYLRIFEQKYPLMLSRMLSDYFPLIKNESF